MGTQKTFMGMQKMGIGMQTTGMGMDMQRTIITLRGTLRTTGFSIWNR